mmetsp:Transcript_42711/g.93189  ORF Transcript_42711/g.93189 Transcript_42711/m.93189 type:complete len:397 (-) Transcript_42711:323-1513(-)
MDSVPASKCCFFGTGRRKPQKVESPKLQAPEPEQEHVQDDDALSWGSLPSVPGDRSPVQPAPVGCPGKGPDDVSTKSGEQAAEDNGARESAMASALEKLNAGSLLEAQKLLASFSPPFSPEIDGHMKDLRTLFEHVKHVSLDGGDLAWEVAYDEGGADGATVEFVWDDEHSEGWFRANFIVPGALPAAFVTANELDLQMLWNNTLAENPTDIVEQPTEWKRSVHLMIAMCMGFIKVDNCCRVRRFYGPESSFLCEHIESYPDETKELPALPRKYTRMEALVCNTWVPIIRNGKDNTLLMQVQRLRPGFKVPRWLLKQVVKIIFPTLVAQFQLASKSFESNPVWKERLATDDHGLYQAMQRVLDNSKLRPVPGRSPQHPVAPRNPPGLEAFDALALG